MCYGKTKCQKPKELKGQSEMCSLEQIKECHGDTKRHSCLSWSDERAHPKETE